MQKLHDKGDMPNHNTNVVLLAGLPQSSPRYISQWLNFARSNTANCYIAIASHPNTREKCPRIVQLSKNNVY